VGADLANVVNEAALHAAEADKAAAWRRSATPSRCRRYVLRHGELLDRLDALLGGRVAEELIFGDVSTGAENDLERAIAMARHRVTRYSRSEREVLDHEMLQQAIEGKAHQSARETVAG